jgi:hypothetical protein
MGRRGGEIGDVGSNLGFFLIHVEELKALGGVGFVEVWVGVIVGGYKLTIIIMSVLFWLCKL